MSLFLPVDPLRSNQPIVDPETGNPTPQFARLWELLFGNADHTQGTFNARQVIAGAGLDGGGTLDGDVTLTADVQEILDQVSTTRGTVLYRGNAAWAGLAPGTSGHFLKTNGAGADPAWASAAVAFRGALVTKTSDETTANYSTAKIVTFATEDYDTSNIHDISSTITVTIASPGVVTWTGHTFLANAPVQFSTTGALPTGITAGTTYYVKSPAANTFRIAATPGGADINTSGSQSGTHTGRNISRLIVPSGVTRVRLRYNILLSNVTANTVLQSQVLKNNVSAYTGNPAVGDTSADTSPRWGAESPVLTVVAGDYFELELGTGADNSVTVVAGYTWFAMEIVE